MRNYDSNRQDLHLRCVRGRSTRWEVHSSPARYYNPLQVGPLQDGNVYVQGTICNEMGEELSIGAVGELIDKYGKLALNYLEGSYVIAVDSMRHGIWSAADHCGTLPLYYKLTPDELVVTSRSENMRVQSPEELDIEGLLSTLNTGYPWGDLTLLRAWKVLRPGQVVQIDNGNVNKIDYYFDPENDEQMPGYHSARELLEDIDAGLMAVASQNKKLLIPLSGGVDSRLISLQCHKLGIPFEAITFVANVPDGDDFDIASRLAKIYNVKHHRWEWSPSMQSMENFRRLCVSTGGTNDAFVSYPDGMSILADVASEFDCVLRGDHSFGFGSHSESLYQSARELCINFKDNLEWVLRNREQDEVDLTAVFEENEGISARLSGKDVNAWRHKCRRLGRNPRFHLPIGHLQAEHIKLAYPLLTKRIVHRMARTDVRKQNEKLLAIEALEAGSPPDIRCVPHSTRDTWQAGEPLLDLPKELIEEMIEIVRKPDLISEFVDESAVVDQFDSYVQARNKVRKADIRKNAKQFIKRLLPKGMITKYQEKVSYPKTAPHMIFKRLFAAKVFLQHITCNGVQK